MYNTSSLHLSFVPNTFLTIIHSTVPLWALYDRCKNHESLLSHLLKTFLILLNQVWLRHSWVFPLKIFHNFPGIYQPLQWFTGILIIWAFCPFYKVTEFFKLRIYSSNLSRIGNDFTLHDFLNFPLHVSFVIFRFSWRLLSVRSIRDCIQFKEWEVKYGMDFPGRWDIEFECPVSSFSNPLKGPYSCGLTIFVARLVFIFVAFNITKSLISMSDCGIACWF